MEKIVGDLQDYARPVEAQLETISLSALVDGVLQQVPHDDTVRVTTALNDVHRRRPTLHALCLYESHLKRGAGNA